MRFADHGVLGDAEAPSDFRSGGAGLPQTAQLFDEGRGPNRSSGHCASIFGGRIEYLLLYIVMDAEIKKKTPPLGIAAALKKAIPKLGTVG